MDKNKLKNVVEAILVASDRILNVNQIEKMLTDKSKVKKSETNSADAVDEPAAANDEQIETSEQAQNDTSENEVEETETEAKDDSSESVSLKRAIKEVIEVLQQDYSERAMELKEVASGYRIQVRQDYAEEVGKLWEERPAKYSRALLETLVLIAYRQPITRGEIEAIRGVSVSSHIIKTLMEREWVRVIGHRDVPGKPAIFGSTKEFLDYFNLKSLDELPSLAEIKDLDKVAPELALSENAAVKELVENASEASDINMPDASSDRQKIQVRLMRRTKRMARRLQNTDEIAENDEIQSEELTASQETESDEA